MYVYQIFIVQTLHFQQLTDQTNYDKQTKTELKQNYDQMTNLRQDFYDHDAIQHEYLDKLGMRYPQDEN